MLFQNACIENDKEWKDIRIEDGKFSRIASGLKPLEGEEVIDLGGKLVLPPYVESHVHLDACLTAGDPCWNMSGTLFEGIECWGKRKDKLSAEDIKERVRRCVRLYAQHGCQFIRTHVDVTDPSLTAMKTILDLKEELKSLAEIQVVAFPQDGILSFPNGKDLMKEAVAMGADVVGAIPHYEFTREYSVESLNFAMNLAAENDLLVDVHCDEIDDEASRGLETLATRALEMQMFDKVTASHTTAMHSYNNAYVLKLMRLLKLSRINFVSNPLVNIHLGGRADAYPIRRGVTRIKELTENGLNVSFGNDDIFDPWYPMGNGNMRDVVCQGLNISHMMGYEDICNGYRFVTENAAKTLHITDHYGVEEGKPANMIVLDAPDYYDALNNDSALLYSVRGGRIIVKGRPAETQILTD